MTHRRSHQPQSHPLARVAAAAGVSNPGRPRSPPPPPPPPPSSVSVACTLTCVLPGHTALDQTPLELSGPCVHGVCRHRLELTGPWPTSQQRVVRAGVRSRWSSTGHRAPRRAAAVRPSSRHRRRRRARRPRGPRFASRRRPGGLRRQRPPSRAGSCPPRARRSAGRPSAWRVSSSTGSSPGCPSGQAAAARSAPSSCLRAGNAARTRTRAMGGGAWCSGWGRHVGRRKGISRQGLRSKAPPALDAILRAWLPALGARAPSCLCACKMAKSSLADQLPRLMPVLSWLHHRSRHCLPVRPARRARGEGSGRFCAERGAISRVSAHGVDHCNKAKSGEGGSGRGVWERERWPRAVSGQRASVQADSTARRMQPHAALRALRSCAPPPPPPPLVCQAAAAHTGQLQRDAAPLARAVLVDVRAQRRVLVGRPRLAATARARGAAHVDGRGAEPRGHAVGRCFRDGVRIRRAQGGGCG